MDSLVFDGLQFRENATDVPTTRFCAIKKFRLPTYSSLSRKHSGASPG
jgi:hypothetical protein